MNLVLSVDGSGGIPNMSPIFSEPPAILSGLIIILFFNLYSWIMHIKDKGALKDLLPLCLLVSNLSVNCLFCSRIDNVNGYLVENYFFSHYA